jgi:hypothetical protein
VLANSANVASVERNKLKETILAGTPLPGRPWRAAREGLQSGSGAAKVTNANLIGK